MKKLIPTILLLCLFTNSCGVLKRIREDIQSSFAPYYLVQDFTISASRNKTFVKATVYYSQLRENSRNKFVSKVEFNGIEMSKGLLIVEPENDFPCGEEKKEVDSSKVDKPRLTVIPLSKKTPEPAPKESDFFIVLDEFKAENTIAITDPEGKPAKFQLNADPITFDNPKTIKLSRTKDNIIQLRGKGSGKNENLSYFIRQDFGQALDEKELIFNPSDNTIKIPASSIKKLKKGKASFFLNSLIIGTVSNLPGQMFSVSYNDDTCVEIID